MVILDHMTPIEMPLIDIWEEQINADGVRSYVCLKTAATPPAASFFAKSNPPKQGISMLVLSPDGKLLASRNDANPSTVWVWSMRTGKLVTVMVHHCPVKHLEWHSEAKDLLLVLCTMPEPFVHLWKSSWIMPLVIQIPLRSIKGRYEARWLQSADADSFNLLFSSQNQTTRARISLAGDILPESDIEGSQSKLKFSSGPEPEDMFDEGNSLDLSPIKGGPTEDLAFLGESDFGYTGQTLDDTFHYRKQARVGG